MTKKEFAVFLAAIETAYPKWNPANTTEQFSLWYDLLGEYSIDIARLALKKHILTNKYPPSIADINMLVSDLIQDRIPDADEAWGEVTKSIRTFGYMQEDKALESMTEHTRNAVKRIGYQSICQSPYEQQNTLRAQFRGAYEAERKRSMEIHRMPGHMRLEQESMQQAALPMKE